LALERSAVNFHDDECGDAIRTSYRTSYISPSACTNAHDCVYLGVSTISSDRKYRQRFDLYGWNKDFTPVVGIR